MLLVLLVSEGDVIEDRDDEHTFFEWLKRFVVCGVIAAMTNIFIPTTKELLYIYGIGGTIDYIRTNDTAKTASDKCIRCLTVLRINILTNLKKINNYGNAHMV